MHPYFLALPIPLTIRSRLATFCYGLPQVKWTEEENLYLILRYFGPLNDLVESNIHESLQNLFFTPFSFVLQGISHSRTKGNRNVIRVDVGNNLQIASLKKEIDRQLRDLHLPIEERSFQPHLILGYYENINPQRLGDYLTAHAGYQSTPIEVTSCLLMRSLQTPKHIIYETVEEYRASPPTTGED